MRPELLTPYLARCTRCELVALTADLPSVKEHSGRIIAMVEPASGSACLKELDAMIGCAEAACERYRRMAERKGIPPPLAARRHRTLQIMEDTLARLRANRAAAES